MLRIGEKKELILWKREGLFSKNLAKGFLIALSVHLILLWGLKITSRPNPDAFPPLAPVAVEVDYQKPVDAPPPPPALSPIQWTEAPKQLEIPIESAEKTHFFFHGLQKVRPDFSEIEKIEYEILEND